MLEGVQITSGIGPKAAEKTGAPSANSNAPGLPKNGASETEKFGDVWKDIQAKYGAKAEKPREIKKTLGKDDFLRIMVTQMKNQDPTEPFKAEQMAAQLAQFASVEQLQNLNQSFGKMANQNQPLERLAMTNLIGKTLTVDRDRFLHTQGTNESIGFTVPRDAASVSVQVVSDTGEIVLEKGMGQLAAGEHKFTWDGVKSNTLPAGNGNYSIKVSAVDDHGNKIEMPNQAQARVVGVSFEGLEAVLLVGDPKNPDKIPMKSVVRIDEGSGGGPAIPGAASLAQAVAPQAQASPAAAAIQPVMPAGAQGAQGLQGAQGAQGQPPQSGANFFSFQKGVGSTTIDPSKLDPKVREALKQYENETAAAAQAAKATGFPSGLDPEESDAIQSEAKAASSAGLQNQGKLTEKGGGV